MLRKLISQKLTVCFNLEDFYTKKVVTRKFMIMFVKLEWVGKITILNFDSPLKHRPHLVAMGHIIYAILYLLLKMW